VGGNVSSCRRKEIQIKIRKLPSDGDEKTERGRETDGKIKQKVMERGKETEEKREGNK